MTANLRLYPWFQFCTNLLFWQGIWFLFFQERLSPAEAILMYAIYDISTTALEVPLGYLSDRVGRRVTLVLSSVGLLLAASMQAIGGGFWVYALAQVALGASKAFASGTDSALLYESLARSDRAAEIEAEELRSWRYSFAALALSALTGGVLAQESFVLAYVATAMAAAGALWIALCFTEPPHGDSATGTEAGTLREMLTHPVLLWCLVLSLAMYVFSHVPFVFGQPFILSALQAQGWAAEAPLVSGAVSAAMMVVSVGTSWLAPVLRRAIGFAGILLLAFAMQIGLIGALSASGSTLIIGLLLFRMVPDSLARPFVLARIQPLLQDRRRATYLSVQSFVGRLIFAGTLLLASSEAGDVASLVHAELRAILFWYVAAGLAILLGLAATTHMLGERPPE
ncbi:MAG: MFS transporter [Paracoccaceae bacterium]